MNFNSSSIFQVNAYYSAIENSIRKFNGIYTHLQSLNMLFRSQNSRPQFFKIVSSQRIVHVTWIMLASEVSLVTKS